MIPDQRVQRQGEQDLGEDGAERNQHRLYDWTEFQERYAAGEWRTPIFADMIWRDIRAQSPNSLTLLDIGCGAGFDDEERFQHEFADACKRMIGVEPDPAVPVAKCFDDVHRTLLEDARLPDESVDVAWSVMVLEHVAQPEKFFAEVHRVLRPGGVFWAFTVDSRHYFVKLTRLLSLLRLKELYLQRLHGEGGTEPFRHYPTVYRCNSPATVRRVAKSFTRMEFGNLMRVGQLDYYLPAAVRPVFHGIDRMLVAGGRPGALLTIRLTK